MRNRVMQGQMSPRQFYENKYRTSRMNLLLVVIFTAINMVLLVTNANSYFLFSAFIPYFITGTGMFLCGRFSEDYYTDGFEDMLFLDNSIFIALLLISIVLTLLYLLAWFMSNKNRVGWLIFTLVFFGLDTLGVLVLNGISLESAMDILFHAWIIYYLILGISAHYKLKKLPPEEEAEVPYGNAPQLSEENAENPDFSASETPNSYVIREADKEVKQRVLAEAHILNYDICYRRVNHTNELIVNGKVYDELQGVVEYPHNLKAWVDGHYISASYTGTHSIISFDGENIAKKLRLY